jgi:hypothetical protein
MYFMSDQSYARPISPASVRSLYARIGVSSYYVRSRRHQVPDFVS